MKMSIGFAIDMSGEGKLADHPKEAGTFAQTTLANSDQAEQRFHAAIKALAAESLVDKQQIAAIDYCFGGPMSCKCHAGAGL